MKRFVLSIIAIMAIASVSYAADYWVWSGIPASGDGSSGSPFKTITQANNVVLPADVIHIYRGDYSGEADVVIVQAGIQVIGELSALPPGVTDLTPYPEKPTIHNFSIKIAGSGVHASNLAFVFDMPVLMPADVNLPKKGAIHLQTNTSGIVIEMCTFTRVNGAFAQNRLETFVGILNDSPVTSLQIKDNTFTGWRSGIFLWDANNVEITGSIFENNLVGISVRGPMYPTGVMVLGNQFAGSTWEAIGVGPGTPPVNGTPVLIATGNSFVDNGTNGLSYTINNYTNQGTGPFIIDAKDNWWNSSDGPFEKSPGFADALGVNHTNPTGLAVVTNRSVNSPNVQYIPWLTEDPFIILPGDPGLVLWFDPMRINNTNPLSEIPPLPASLPANDAKVAFWMNQGNPFACTSAVAPLPLPWKEPVFKTADFSTPWSGLSGWPGMNFTEVATYGQSSVMTFPASPLVTSNWPSSPLIPIVSENLIPQESKNLFIAFKANAIDMQSPTPQVIFEVGGAISGMNAYVQNGYLVMGIWNRLECAFFQMTSPLGEGTHLAHLEFQYEPTTYFENGEVNNPGLNQVRMILDGNPSPWATFHGLQFDASASGIGAEVGGTMFFNRIGVFNDYARFFTGLIGDIKLYSGSIMTPDVLNVEYTYYNERYGTAPAIALPPTAPAKNSAWIVNNETKPEKDNSGSVADVYPNPFNNSATLALNLTESQNVRIELFDMTGVKMLSIYDGNASKGQSSFNINGTGLPTGVYTLKITGINFTSIEKVILSK